MALLPSKAQGARVSWAGGRVGDQDKEKLGMLRGAGGALGALWAEPPRLLAHWDSVR